MLSIIIPTLNEEKYLPLLLDSIRKQTFKDYEIIVSDARSEDKTIEIAKKYGAKIVKGGFLSYGRNRGADAASGEILLFLDADIVLPDEHFLEIGLKEFEKRGLGVAGFRLVPNTKKFIDKFAYFVYTVVAVIFGGALPHAAAAIMIKKEVHQKIGGFDEKIIFVEDHPYVREAGKIAKFRFITKVHVLVSMRRFEKDGRWLTYFKYMLAGLYIIFIGPIESDIFNYKFSHYDKGDNAKK